MSRYRNARRIVAAAALLALLLPAAMAAVVWGPYVTTTTENSAAITWKTASPAEECWVEYAPEGGEVYHIPSSGEGAVHQVLLTGLAPATTYRYRIGAGNEAIEGCRFRTFGDEAFTCIVYGDTRAQKPFFTQADRHGLVAERIAAEENILFVIHTGDFVCEEEEWDEFFAVAGSMLRNTTLVPVAGNHDGSAEAFAATFGLPANYSFDAGSLHVTVLDSNDRAWADMDSQTAWLKEDLLSPLPHKLVAFHHPPFSADRQHPGGDLALRAEWCGILSGSGVDAVFSAHTHAYERYRINGTEYIVVGCGGAPFYALSEEKPTGYRAGLEQTLGYVRATVSPDVVTLEMVAVAGVTEDGEVTPYPPGTVIDAVRLHAAPAWWDVPGSLLDSSELHRLRR
ncbi:metallophosphoesterase family protein [Methanoculleus sp. Wushi-C6]|uniref:Metallophosphoesterase family protein n=1 Tax=Methanoculleus caldifontis TaxID=2651577 RepID=A0ABU3X0Z6_9EURY|nr:metallophosphoesterase family protein [Methanoculleus sp. Wushi-C6]MDV2481733.1 metallophosphoesterase family protein [Methanoculleus sp. Wushi-C6]